MAIADPDEIVTALKSILAGLGGLTAYAIEPASPKYPAAWIFFRQPAISFDVTFDSGYTIRPTVTVAVQGTAEHQQSNIRPYLAPTGDKSVVATIQDDPSLGLPGVDASVLEVSQIGPIGAAGTGVWGATFPLEIFVSPI